MALDSAHERRLQLLNVASDCVRAVPGVLTTVSGDLEEQVSMITVAIERLQTANNNVENAVGSGATTGAIINANTQIEAAIDAIYEALMAVGNARVAAAGAIESVERTYQRVLNAPNN